MPTSHTSVQLSFLSLYNVVINAFIVSLLFLSVYNYHAPFTPYLFLPGSSLKGEEGPERTPLLPHLAFCFTKVWPNGGKNPSKILVKRELHILLDAWRPQLHIQGLEWSWRAFQTVLEFTWWELMGWWRQLMEMPQNLMFSNCESADL